MGGDLVRLTVHADLCTGHGRCYTLAPDLLDCDDEGFVTLRGQTMDVPDGQLMAAQGRRRRLPGTSRRAPRRLSCSSDWATQPCAVAAPVSFDAEVGSGGRERLPLLGQIAVARPQLVGPDEHVLEALGLVPGEVGRIGVRGADVDGELTVLAGRVAQFDDSVAEPDGVLERGCPRAEPAIAGGGGPAERTFGVPAEDQRHVDRLGRELHLAEREQRTLV